MTFRAPCGRSFFCDAVAYSDKCEIHRKVALELLEEVEITGFTGADEEMKLVSMLFHSSNSIKHMAPRGDAIGRRHLMKVPSTSSDRGCWNLAEQVLNWTGRLDAIHQHRILHVSNKLMLAICSFTCYAMQTQYHLII